MVVLIAMSDHHFAWMLGAAMDLSLKLPPGGVDEPSVIAMLRTRAEALRSSRVDGHWMIVVDNEVVGMCGYKHLPDADCAVEIGYGIAASRRRCGYATAGIGALVEIAVRDSSIRRLTAETVTTNVASQRVLEHNAFVRVGRRDDPEDGEVICWQHNLTARR